MSVDIIGQACVAPGAKDVKELVELLRQGRCTVTSIPPERWDLARFWHPAQGVRGKSYTFAAGIIDDVYGFDPHVYGLSQREAMQMDPQQRLMLDLVWRAIEDANLPITSLSEERVGVYVGASSLESSNLASEDPASGSPYFMTGNTLSIVSNRISHIFGLSGPSMTIDTACSSSLVALHEAFAALESGAVDTAIVGGVNLLMHPLSYVGFAQARMLSPEGLCRAYDNNGQGYVRSEGGVAMVLRRSDRALGNRDRSHASIVAIGVNSSGRTNGISLPSREAQALLLKTLYQEIDIDLDDLAFIEGHGTGTKVGDPAEVWAIGNSIGKGRRLPIPIGSIKSNIGHTEPASGLFGLLKAGLALSHDFLPASLHVEQLNENIDFAGLNVCVNTQTRELSRGETVRYAGVNSFGFGGTNAHVIICDPARRPAAEAVDLDHPPMFMASAHTRAALEPLLEAYRERLNGADGDGAKRLIAASGANRAPMKHRWVLASGDKSAVMMGIDRYLASGKSSAEVGEASHDPAKVAFVFGGNGSQWAGMGAEPYRQNPLFKQSFDRISGRFERYLDGEKLNALLVTDDLNERLADTRIAQPLLFAVQAALADTLLASGLKPQLVYGHSVGEIAAAYCAGILILDEAVEIVAKRSQSQAIAAGAGKMAAVVLNAESTLQFAARHGLTSIAIAAINGPASVTIAGTSEEIKTFRDRARAEHVVVQILTINYPFHHPIMEKTKSAFFADPPVATPRNGGITFLSTVTGAIEEGIGLDNGYWWRNLRDPVLFAQATEEALDLGCNLFVEVSPRAVVSSYVSEVANQQNSSVSVIPTLRKDPKTSSGLDPIETILARAAAHGAHLSINRSRRDSGLDLPPLPLQRQELRMPPTSDELDVFGRDRRESYTLLGWRSDPNGFHWKNHIDAKLFPDLAEHVVESRSILPASGFIEMLTVAAHAYLNSDEVEITNLEILRPLELRTDKTFELSTLLSDETGNIEIRSRERLSNDDWTIHAVARVRHPVSGREVTNKSRLETPQSVMGCREVYELASRFGLDYGLPFQLLSQARIYEQGVVEVDLKPADEAIHPYIGFELNPFLVDAAFHGLVALFGAISGADAGAPYIPVRFGSIRRGLGAGAIARARILIERYSQHSVKANFQLLDADGNVVAVFTDCRFRKTSLKAKQSLASVAFHYESLPCHLNALRVANTYPAGLPEEPTAEAPISDATLLLEAAIHRSCQEIALAVATSDGKISRVDLKEQSNFAPFLTDCLYILEDAGMATVTDGEWTVETQISLPSLRDIVAEVQAEDASRMAEAILINNAYCDALANVTRKSSPTADLSVSHNDATLEHVDLHAPLAMRRQELALEAASSILQQDPQTAVVMQLGRGSLAFSRRLAAMSRETGAQLIVAEPREAVRRMLELEFEGQVDVVVVAPADLSKLPPVDLVVAADAGGARLISEDGEIHAFLKRSCEHGVRLILVDLAPSVFQDFVYGQRRNWLSGHHSATLPVGRIGTATETQKLLEGLGFHDVTVKEGSYPEGPLIIASTGRKATPGAEQHLDDCVAIVIAERPGAVRLANSEVPVFDTKAFKAAIAAICLESDTRRRRIIYGAATGAEPGDGAVERLVDRLDHFRTLVEELKSAPAASERAPQLFIVAPGGSPLAGPRADAANSGLWSLGRVIQNEYPDLEAHLLDTDGVLDDQLLITISALAALDQPNREWLVDATGVRELRVAPGAHDRSLVATSKYRSAAIAQRTDGRIDSITWQASQPPQPQAQEVVVEVHATGLNYRDVMWAMGVLPEEALEDGFAGPTIGMEFAGRVLAVGEGVSDLSAGDHVMGIGPAAFATHVRVHHDGMSKIPADFDLAAAATVPVAFLTAYYAMIHLGRIQAGETILIHGAAGGVGLAALQLAKLKGATIIATAGTVEKRQLLKLLGADHVFDSRSLDFVADVLGVTKGQGVDLVLNSLFSEAMERSIELLKPFGRFLELGKRDYYSDRKVGLRPFRRNISYYGIDADQLLIGAPAVTKSIFADIEQLFKQKTLKPLPHRIFRHEEIADAFRLMQQSGQVGKIVVRPPIPGKDAVARRSNALLQLDSQGVFLVVGGIGGFGLAAAEWLVARGARHLALSSRKGIADADTGEAIERWTRKGVMVSLHACDVTNEAALAGLLRQLRDVAPIRGVVHAAMVLDDALLANLTTERNKAVIEVKVKGADHLDRLTRSDNLQLFLLFSSATTMVGNPGQANYVAANGYLEGLARARRASGLPALAVGFGAIADKGYLARNEDVGELLSKRLGKSAMQARDALAQVERYLLEDTGSVDAATVVIAQLDWQALRLLPLSKTALLEIAYRSNGASETSDGERSIDLERLVRETSKEEAQHEISKLIAAEIATLLRLPEADVAFDRSLKDLGLDSLMGMELGMSLQEKTGHDVPLSGIGDETTVRDVVNRLYDKLVKHDSDVAEEQEKAAVVEGLVKSHSGNSAGRIAAE